MCEFSGSFFGLDGFVIPPGAQIRGIVWWTLRLAAGHRWRG